MGKVISLSDLLSLCVKHATRFNQKLKLRRAITNGPTSSTSRGVKSFVTVVSNKAIKLVKRKKTDQDHEDDFGDGGVWQRSILMGDKCQPLDFSGVIYYDSNGKQLNEVPLRSPRASPLPAYLVHAGKE